MPRYNGYALFYSFAVYWTNLRNIYLKSEVVTQTFILQVSLILEFCSHGNVREYLKEHSKDFKENISPKELNKRNSVIDDIGDRNKHTLRLLIAWSFQVEAI